MKKYMLTALAVCVAAPAMADVIVYTDKAAVYTDKAAFLAATGASKTSFSAADAGTAIAKNDPYTVGAVTFTSAGEFGETIYDDGNYGAGIAYLEGDPVVTAVSTTNAVGFDIGSFAEPFEVDYAIGTTTGSFTLPAATISPNGFLLNTTFIGFIDTSPITVAFDGETGLDFTDVYAAKVTPGVPEPASWAMMVLGFGAIGAAVRRRQAAVRFA